MKAVVIYLSCALLFIAGCSQKEPEKRDLRTDKQNEQMIGSGAEAESLMKKVEETSPDLDKQTDNLKDALDNSGM